MEDEVAITVSIIMICAAMKLLKKRKVKRKCWTRPWIKRRSKFGAHHALLDELRREDPKSYKNFIRLDDAAFQELLQLVTPLIKRKDTCMRDAIPPAERLSLTLRFLATGDSYQSLEYLFRIPKQTLSYIIPDTCKAIYTVLKDKYLKAGCNFSFSPGFLIMLPVLHPFYDVDIDPKMERFDWIKIKGQLRCVLRNRAIKE
ncbi:hypothetical protein KUTeg_022574 [Tegillarca granosa]|uniref:Uncharacterized protein n=1 Tax=Tegillarca granosa TaxID=220873 RepID=A0ABQ9E7C9_TEGGR|nr:hypothetical protein KUTeg_022574 [Tegillarca granosa]